MSHSFLTCGVSPVTGSSSSGEDGGRSLRGLGSGRSGELPCAEEGLWALAESGWVSLPFGARVLTQTQGHTLSPWFRPCSFLPSPPYPVPLSVAGGSRVGATPYTDALTGVSASGFRGSVLGKASWFADGSGCLPLDFAEHTWHARLCPRCCPGCSAQQGGFSVLSVVPQGTCSIKCCTGLDTCPMAGG